MILDLQQLLAPIPGAAPAGVDLRSDAAAGDAYYRMKDARSTARASERDADSKDEAAARPPEWRQLLDLAQDALTAQSKDLEVAAWLSEAILRLHGFAGLRDGFALIHGLVDRYWDVLFSVDTETVEDKVAPLVGLNGATGDGTLIQPIRLAPLTNPAEGVGLWHVMAARRGGPGAAAAQARVDSALRSTDSATLVAVVSDLRECLAAHAALTDRLDLLCGNDTPPSANIRQALTDALDIAVELAGPALTAVADAPLPDAAPPFAGHDAAAGQVAAPVAAVPPPGTIADREDALRQLSRIATFFKDAEPNAPTGFVLETLIRRARLPLAELIRELLPDDTARQQLLLGAGIGAAKPPE